MEPCAIGDVTLEPAAPCLCVTMAAHPFATFWSVADVDMVINYLQRWREMQAPSLASHACPWCGDLCLCTNEWSCRHVCGERRAEPR